MVRVAIIGLGAVTRDIHLPAYAHLAGRARVVAGCDIDPEARARAGREGRVPEVYADPAEMIERTGPDVVAICTPPACHREQVLLALARGRHVFCEKPLAEDLAQADEIVRAAEEARRLVVVNNQFPYMRIHRAAREMIGEPEFGRLLYLHAWQTVRPAVGGEPGWRGRLKRSCLSCTLLVDPASAAARAHKPDGCNCCRASQRSDNSDSPVARFRVLMLPHRVRNGCRQRHSSRMGCAAQFGADTGQIVRHLERPRRHRRRHHVLHLHLGAPLPPR